MSMSESDFERPGATHHPAPAEWPYHAPSPAPPLNATNPVAGSDRSGTEASVESQRTSSARVVGITVVAAIVGVIGGSVLTAFLLRTQETQASVEITLETFPRELMGVERNDLALREAGFGPTVARLDSEFEDQMAAFRFAYGGDGATLGYGRRVDLTIADALLPSQVPRRGERDSTGAVRETRRLISLRSAEVSCTFEPTPPPDPARETQEVGDFSSKGLTECVLVDRSRNLSLRIAHNPQFGGDDAFDAAADFSKGLKDLHNLLTHEG